MSTKTPIRQCIVCRTQKSRNELVRVTRLYSVNLKEAKVLVEPSRIELGRSAYICKNDSCIQVAAKERKLSKMLRTNIQADTLTNLLTKYGSSHKEALVS